MLYITCENMPAGDEVRQVRMQRLAREQVVDLDDVELLEIGAADDGEVDEVVAAARAHDEAAALVGVRLHVGTKVEVAAEVAQAILHDESSIVASLTSTAVTSRAPWFSALSTSRPPPAPMFSTVSKLRPSWYWLEMRSASSQPRDLCEDRRRSA